MLDYIKLFIKDPNAMKSDFPKLNLREEKENFLEKIYRTGKLKNLDIKITYEGIWIHNSLCKFIHTRYAAIDLLSEYFDRDISSANVYAFEFGESIQVEYNPTAYISCLGTLSYLNKHEYGKDIKYNGLAYNNNIRDSKFYEKVLEIKKKKKKDLADIPTEIFEKFFLRYEIRYKKGVNKKFQKKLSKFFNEKELKAYMFYDKKMFNYLVNLWGEVYHKIYKKNKFVIKKNLNMT